ncbi:hypothetical protein vseg_002240 [Gypsophila vaccaria]
MDMLAFYLLLATCFAHFIPLFTQSAPPISSHITVVGAVYCDTCLNSGFSTHSYFMPGVDVNIRCKFNAKSPRTTEMISIAVNRSTDNNGVYKLEIPSVDGVDCIDGPPIQSFCQATLVGSSSSACSIPALRTTTDAVSVKSRPQNVCVYSFTPLSFRPINRNDTLCKQQADQLSDSANTSKFLLPPSYA